MDFPVVLDVADHPVLVIGGGHVAGRKVFRLLSSGARVRVISPELTPELRECWQSGKIEWIPRPAELSDCEGYALVFAMTGDGLLNESVARHVKSLGGFCDTATASALRTMRSMAQGTVGNLLLAATSSPPDPLFSRMTLGYSLSILESAGIELFSKEHGRLREALLSTTFPPEEVTRGLRLADLDFFREHPDPKDRFRSYGEWFGPDVADRVLADGGNLKGQTS